MERLVVGPATGGPPSDRGRRTIRERRRAHQDSAHRLTQGGAHRLTQGGLHALLSVTGPIALLLPVAATAMVAATVALGRSSVSP